MQLYLTPNYNLNSCYTTTNLMYVSLTEVKFFEIRFLRAKAFY